MMMQISFLDGDKTINGYLNEDNIEYMYRTKSYTVVGLVSGKTMRVYEKPETLLKTTADVPTDQKETKRKRKSDSK